MTASADPKPFSSLPFTMAEHRKYLIDELTGSKSGIEQARSWLVQHPEEAPAAVDLLVDDLKSVKSYARCLNVL